MADPAPKPDAVMGKLEASIRRKAVDDARREVSAGIQNAFSRIRLDGGRRMTLPYHVSAAVQSALKEVEQSIGDAAVAEFHNKYQQLLEEFPIGD